MSKSERKKRRKFQIEFQIELVSYGNQPNM